jgi:p70 ribosomal S6 kinase
MTKFYLSEIVVGLECLHHKGILYRDLKPENVMLDERGHVRLADFGVSKVLPKEGGLLTRTFCGSKEYMSPEMLSGDHSHGMPSDIYSLGVIMAEMLTGQPPFTCGEEETREQFD